MLHGPPSKNFKPGLRSPRSKMSGERPTTKDFYISKEQTPKEHASREHANSNAMKEYVPKVPHAGRSHMQGSPEKVPLMSRSHMGSPRTYNQSNSTTSDRNFNLSTTTFDALKQAQCVSPWRANQQLEGMIKDGFQNLKTEVGQVKLELGKIGSRVDNLSTAVNILTNMQGILVEKVVDFKLRNRQPSSDGAKH